MLTPHNQPRIVREDETSAEHRLTCVQAREPTQLHHDGVDMWICSRADSVEVSRTFIPCEQEVLTTI